MKKNFLDKDWLTAFNQGNSSAFREIFENYNRLLFTCAVQLVKDKEQAEDIVSEAFAKLWQRHETFNNEDQ